MFILILKLLLCAFVLLLIIIPVCANLLKQKIYKSVKEEIKEQQKHDDLRKEMFQGKKGGQGKTLLK